MPATGSKKANRKAMFTRIIALSLAVILLGSVLLAALLSNFVY